MMPTGPGAEQLTVLLLVGSHLLLTPFVLSDDGKTAAVALVVLIATALTLMATRGVDLMVYTHYVPGTSALVVGKSILRGDGGPIVTAHVWGVLFIFIEEAVVAQFLAVRVYTRHFYSLGHNLLHLFTAGWMASFLADHAVRWRYPQLLDATRTVRAVYDPSIMIALGVLMIGHEHDTTFIGEFFHDVWGVAFVAMGLLHLLSSCVHAVQPREAPLSALARAVHSYSWTFNGLWACLMGIWISVWGDGGRFQYQKGSGRWTGMREVIFPALKQDLPSGFEEGCALLAITLWLTGAMAATQFVRASTSASRRPTRAHTDARMEEGASLLSTQ